MKTIVEQLSTLQHEADLVGQQIRELAIKTNSKVHIDGNVFEANINDIGILSLLIKHRAIRTQSNMLIMLIENNTV